MVAKNQEMQVMKSTAVVRAMLRSPNSRAVKGLAGENNRMRNWSVRTNLRSTEKKNPISIVLQPAHGGVRLTNMPKKSGTVVGIWTEAAASNIRSKSEILLRLLKQSATATHDSP